jgi:hypothetical protein
MKEHEIDELIRTDPRLRQVVTTTLEDLRKQGEDGCLQVFEVKMTPRLARQLLQINTCNRNPKPSAQVRFARDMRSGKWCRTGSPIQIGWDWVLIDGGNRLQAVCDSEECVLMTIAINVTPEARAAVDKNIPRTTVDSAQLAGLDRTINSQHVAMLRQMLLNVPGMVGLKLTDAELIELLPRYREGIDFVLETVSKTKRITAAVRAAVARAFYWGADRDRLRRFLEILKGGLASSPEDQAAYLLVRFMVSLKATGGQVIRDEIYEKTEAALSAFLERRPIVRLYSAARELFPLPMEMMPTDLSVGIEREGGGPARRAG